MIAVSGRYWRLLTVQWQRHPYASGSHGTGGRWNAVGQIALYLSRDHATAISEYHQSLVRPGTLVGYDVAADRIADLTDQDRLAGAGIDSGVLYAPWRTIYAIDRGVPPSWTLAEQLIADGAQGALVPSVQHRGGVNLVLWRWHPAGDTGEGAAIRLLDPHGDITR